MILQKGNSGRQWRWGCSAFGVLATVAIERPARVRSVPCRGSVMASGVSAILHSVLIVRLIYDNVIESENGGCHYKTTLCKHSFGKGFCSVPILATLLNGILFQLLSILKSVAGNYQRAKARGRKGGKIELQILLETHQKIKVKKSFLHENAVFSRSRRWLQSRVLFFDVHTIHFYGIMIKI